MPKILHPHPPPPNPENLSSDGEKQTRSLQITREARRYAVRELSRRAGVAQDFFQKWTIEFAPCQTTISFGSETSARIHFRHASEDSLNKIAGEAIPVTRARWFQTPNNSLLASDLVLPFCEDRAESPLPLYQSTSSGDIVCELDLLASFLFTLSRLEETLCKQRDEHGRFPASASSALAHKFLERPILDEHGLAFEQVLSHLLPSWRSRPRALLLKLSHDIDEIGIPFQLKTSIGHTVKRRHPGATLRDFLSTVRVAEPTELALVRRLAAISHLRGLHSSFYWKASARGPRDSGYDPADPRIQRVVHRLQEHGFEMGVHPGYETFGARTDLAGEVDRLRCALRLNSLGGRQHYLRWSQQTWLDWEACGLSYDSSLGYAEHFGFRAGTAYPYRPWSLQENREVDLIEVPLILMDCTPVKYMQLCRAEMLDRVKAIIQRTAQTGGVFTLLWHNTPLLDRDYDGWYESILDMLSAAKSFQVPTNAKLLW